MSYAVTAGEMIDAARRCSGNETLDPANAFVSDDEALAVLNGQLTELYDTILEHGFGDYFRGSVPIVLQANQSVYPLGVDVYEIVGGDVVWSADIVKSLRLFMEAERNRFRRVRPTWSQFSDIYYRPLGDNIEFIPTPLSAVTVNLLYVPTFTPLVALSDTFNSHNGWHWMAIWGLAAYMRQKDDDEVSAQLALNEKAAQKARVATMAARRVEGEPPRVQRTRRDIWEDD